VHFNNRFPGLTCTRVSILDVIGAKDDDYGGDSWGFKTCKAPVRL